MLIIHMLSKMQLFLLFIKRHTYSLTNIAFLLYLRSDGLKYLCYPDFEEHEEVETGFLERFLRRDLKKYPALKTKVLLFLKKVEEADSLRPFLVAETISYLYGDGYYEMRIPPTQRGGVVRIYFIRVKDNNDTLLLIDAELKKGKASKIKDRIKDRMKNI